MNKLRINLSFVNELRQSNIRNVDMLSTGERTKKYEEKQKNYRE
jgi:hypothetical protein